MEGVRGCSVASNSFKGIIHGLVTVYCGVTMALHCSPFHHCQSGLFIMQRFLRSDSAASSALPRRLHHTLPASPAWSVLGSLISPFSWPSPWCLLVPWSPGMTRHYQLERPMEARAQIEKSSPKVRPWSGAGSPASCIRQPPQGTASAEEVTA